MDPREADRHSGPLEDAEHFSPPIPDAAWPPPPCTPEDHHEWLMMSDEAGNRIGLYCGFCGATIPPPVVEVGAQLVALPESV